MNHVTHAVFVVLYWFDLESNSLLDTKIAFRNDGKILVCQEEIIPQFVRDNLGLEISASRFRTVRKLHLSTGFRSLCTLYLTDDEKDVVEIVAVDRSRSSLNFWPLKDIVPYVDWTVLGMMFNAIVTHE